MAGIRDRRSRRRTVLPALLGTLTLTIALAGSAPAASPVPLGTANSFALLAGSTITNTGSTTIAGDIGLCCTGVAVTGFGSVTQTGGAQHIGPGSVAATAQNDLDIAYANAAGQPVARTLPVDLSLSGTPATPLLPGVYDSTAHGALQINTGLTLDFQGDPNAVFIFQGTTLVTAAAAAGSVNIVNGGSAPSTCNIFWQLSSDATGVTLGAGSAFKGTTMALGGSVLGTGATVQGRILTRRSKAVTLEANTITRPACSTAAPSETGGGGTTPAPGTTTPTPTDSGTTPTAAQPASTSAAVTPPPIAGPDAAAAASAAAAPNRVRPGSARLWGPRLPVSRPFTIFVTGHAIRSVRFYVDGRLTRTVGSRQGRTKFKLLIRPRGQSGGVHRVRAQITYGPDSATSVATRRLTYRRAATSARAPRFAG